MKNLFPYLVGIILLGLLIFLMVTGKTNASRKLDERITLRQRDKIPYGTAVARQLLPAIFPNASLPVDKRYPGAWDSIDMYRPNQAVIIVADYFDADTDELDRLITFAEEGNYVFVSARSFSSDAVRLFHLSTNSDYYDYYTAISQDSLQIKLNSGLFAADSLFSYPGRRHESYFQQWDSTQAIPLGKNDRDKVNFIKIPKGEGSIFLHTAPLAFSNYFILHKNNFVYYQNALSVMPKKLHTVLWNEYFLQKPKETEGEKDPNWLATLARYPAFKWGLLTALFTLILYVLLGMRRKQRIIVSHVKPRNDSLDFVKTLGRLYYDKKDHKNLAQKMTAYFLEHVRSVYKIPTHSLDEDFIKVLSAKSGYQLPELERLVSAAQQIKNNPVITERQLADFHQQLEMFYQKT